MKIINYKKETLNTLKIITRSYPNQLLSSHLSLALADYPNFDSISDKELYFIFEKYRCEKELDITPIATEEDINNIYKDTINLDRESIFDQDEY